MLLSNLRTNYQLIIAMLNYVSKRRFGLFVGIITSATVVAWYYKYQKAINVFPPNIRQDLRKALLLTQKNQPDQAAIYYHNAFKEATLQGLAPEYQAGIAIKLIESLDHAAEDQAKVIAKSQALLAGLESKGGRNAFLLATRIADYWSLQSPPQLELAQGYYLKAFNLLYAESNFPTSSKIGEEQWKGQGLALKAALPHWASCSDDLVPLMNSLAMCYYDAQQPVLASQIWMRCLALLDDKDWRKAQILTGLATASLDDGFKWKKELEKLTINWQNRNWLRKLRETEDDKARWNEIISGLNNTNS